MLFEYSIDLIVIDLWLTPKRFQDNVTDLAQLYGPIITIWFGPLPLVFVCDLTYIKETFNKSIFCGRDNKIKLSIDIIIIKKRNIVFMN